jgi:hypothetical protein
VKRVEEPVARSVAGEDPAGPVAAVRGRRKPDHEQTRVRVTEARERLGPVLLVAMARGRLASRFRSPRNETRTERARYNVAAERFQ